MTKYSVTIILASFALLVAACGGRGEKTAGTQNGTAKSEKPAGDAQLADVPTGMVIAISDSLIGHRRADTIDFGRVTEGEMLAREFKLRNDGDKAFVITRMDVSCGCVTFDYPSQPLRPGAEEPFTVRLDTRGFGGWIYKTVIMQTSLSDNPYLIVVTAEIE